ncbi:hypothetical protein PCANC_08579 [Puccinia coronata f. sp. avenae]|uniref:Uncharacterized protein n=1 Tax=Puccinia coronata f. sp. avenae TaxID=200324 RepID=A0A2N5V1W7_9BASI|nr:hypothetical protein PCASD_11913 [Puccinia coronata f. sp. avenae]PLW43990.1 hypothetical protein PCANC_08579 [Puccinia coronata f. sp. avenae]
MPARSLSLKRELEDIHSASETKTIALFSPRLTQDASPSASDTESSRILAFDQAHQKTDIALFHTVLFRSYIT